MRYIYEAWEGTYYNFYWGNWDRGEWVKISYIYYLWLNLRDYKVRKRLKK